MVFFQRQILSDFTKESSLLTNDRLIVFYYNTIPGHGLEDSQMQVALGYYYPGNGNNFIKDGRLVLF